MSIGEVVIAAFRINIASEHCVVGLIGLFLVSSLSEIAPIGASTFHGDALGTIGSSGRWGLCRSHPTQTYRPTREWELGSWCESFYHLCFIFFRVFIALITRYLKQDGYSISLTFYVILILKNRALVDLQNSAGTILSYGLSLVYF